MTWIHLNVSHLRAYWVIRIDRTYEWTTTHDLIIHLVFRSRFGTDGKTWWRCFSSSWHLACCSFCDGSCGFLILQLRTSSKEFRTQPILKAPEAKGDIEHFFGAVVSTTQAQRCKFHPFFTTGRCSGASTRRWCRSGQDAASTSRLVPNVKTGRWSMWSGEDELPRKKRGDELFFTRSATAARAPGRFHHSRCEKSLLFCILSICERKILSWNDYSSDVDFLILHSFCTLLPASNKCLIMFDYKYSSSRNCYCTNDYRKILWAWGKGRVGCKELEVRMLASAFKM